MKYLIPIVCFLLCATGTSAQKILHSYADVYNEPNDTTLKDIRVNTVGPYVKRIKLIKKHGKNVAITVWQEHNIYKPWLNNQKIWGYTNSKGDVFRLSVHPAVDTVPKLFNSSRYTLRKVPQTPQPYYLYKNDPVFMYLSTNHLKWYSRPKHVRSYFSRTPDSQILRASKKNFLREYADDTCLSAGFKNMRDDLSWEIDKDRNFIINLFKRCGN